MAGGEPTSTHGAWLDAAVVYRAPMRSRTVPATAGAGAEHGVATGVVGVGEPLARIPADLEQALVWLRAEHGEKGALLVARFAALPTGTLVWTREVDGTYRLGCVDGPWRYDASLAATAVGLCHVRATLWSDRRFDDVSVPPGVATTFGRGGMNLQRIHDAAAARSSAVLWFGAAASLPGA